MDDAQKIFDKLNELQAIYGLTVVVLIVLISVGVILFWKYINKKIELKAEETFEKRKTEHSVRFSNSYEKQITAIHNCYSIIQKIRLLMQSRGGKDKFNDKPSKVIFKELVHNRSLFLETYYENKIVFSRSLCLKIDSFLPKLDDYLTELESGFSNITYTKEQLEHNRKTNTPIISGIWIPQEMDKVRIPLDEIIDEIEAEFRIIHGTND